MSRHPRILSETDIYHIMLRGNERKNIFLEGEHKKRFLEGLETRQKEIGFCIYSYCLMNNHVHLLLNTNKNDLASIMKGIAVRYASYFNWQQERVGHVFQDRFKSEAIEDERYLLAVVRYIHNNPVKAGLVQAPDDYIWSSYRFYANPKYNSPRWLDTSFVLEMFSNVCKTAIDEFKKFSIEVDDGDYMDCDSGIKVSTRQEGLAYLEEYLKQTACDLDISQIKKNKVLRNHVIFHLRTHTNLSQRLVAEILGVNKSTVEKITFDEKQP